MSISENSEKGWCDRMRQLVRCYHERIIGYNHYPLHTTCLSHLTQKWKSARLLDGATVWGEDFSDTAKREVFEETGIETEFLSVVSLRHHHKHIFHCSDIYVVCHLRPINEEIQASKEEISQCEWMDIETYRNHPQVSIFNKYVMNAFLESEKLKCAIKVTPVLSIVNDYHKVYNVQSLKEHDKDS